MTPIQKAAARILHNTPNLADHEVLHLKAAYSGNTQVLAFRCRAGDICKVLTNHGPETFFTTPEGLQMFLASPRMQFAGFPYVPNEPDAPNNPNFPT